MGRVSSIRYLAARAVGVAAATGSRSVFTELINKWVMAARGLDGDRVGCRRTIAIQGAQMFACRQQTFGNGEREPEYDARAAP